MFRVWSEWVAALKREVLLHAINGREVVVLDFAELKEAISSGSVRIYVFSYLGGAGVEYGAALTSRRALARNRRGGR